MVFQPDEKVLAGSGIGLVHVEAERPATSLRGLGYGKEVVSLDTTPLPVDLGEILRHAYTRAGIRGSMVLAICSAIVGEGKTTISLGLASTFANDYPDRRVALVETDIERPILARDLGLDP